MNRHNDSTNAMQFDPTDFIPQPRDWFSTDIVYEGHGYAEFESPAGKVKGPVKIKFTEFADPHIEMDIENIETETALQFGLQQFLSGEEAVGGQMSLTLRQNPCKKLEVKTPEGIFLSIGEIRYNPSILIGSDQMGKLSFSLSTSQFDAAEADEAEYWVLPLSNFVWDLDTSFDRLLNPPHPDLDQHPLRIYPTPSIPDQLAPEDAAIARWNANTKNQIIAFEFQGNKGFIEPLTDFEERKNKLESGQERCLITAVMVGRVNQNSINFTDLEQWFPYNYFLSLLGLATGTETGAPWIEFRDAQGQLVRRIHWNLNRSSFSKGYTTIDERFHRNGIGWLLTQASSSQDFREPYLPVVLRQIIKDGPDNTSPADRMEHLCRGFECLCTHYKLNRQNLLNSLDSHQQSGIKGILQTTRSKIRSIANAAVDPNHKSILDRIANKALNAANTDASFGSKVTDLLNRFNFPDANIVDAYYNAFPRADGIGSWSGVLSKYRGAVTHEGYFDNRYDHHDIWTIADHLHDLLVRIVFEILGYDGYYQPIVVRRGATGARRHDGKKADWVTPSLPPSELGY